MDVSIIIINYNTEDLTHSCIKSVLGHSSGFSFEIILVDNASNAFNASRFLELSPLVKVIESPVNVGFAGGNNLGIAKASGTYLLLLNSDCELVENSIGLLLDHYQKLQNPGALSPRLMYPNGIHQSAAQRFPSWSRNLLELFRIHKCFSAAKRARIFLGAYFKNNSNTEADWVWGTCFFFRKELLEQLPDQKLNADYFMYCEDIQWCMDFKNRGFLNYFFAETSVVHLMGGSSGNKNKLNEESYDRFLRANYSLISVFLIRSTEALLKIF